MLGTGYQRKGSALETKNNMKEIAWVSETFLKN